MVTEHPQVKIIGTKNITYEKMSDNKTVIHKTTCSRFQSESVQACGACTVLFVAAASIIIIHHYGMLGLGT
jgi:hypothetical protein